MEPECFKTVVVTPHFLRSACELPDHHDCEILKAIRLFMAHPGDAGLQREPLGGGIHSMRAGGSCRILFAAGREIKLLFVGSDNEARRFAEHACADATAFAEAPIAFQLHIDFWQAGPAENYESPSCGTPVSADDLEGLILHARRYLPLAQLLLSRGPEAGSVDLSFREMAAVLGQALPQPAVTSPAWWANDRTHAQANAWLAIGWRATAHEIRKEKITFVRNARRTPESPD
ncbi:MAG: hypothetical protein LAP85_07695 [Acidobacteriia bacterium]|nr:hypothetical protein [Terriglobia bacterium]